MKKIIILTALLLALGVSSAEARRDHVARKFTVTGRHVAQRNDTVHITFDVAVGKRVARTGHTVVYRPYLENGKHRWDLPEIIVRDARADVATQRQEWAAGKAIEYHTPVTVRGGGRVHYTTAVPLQGWMDGANLGADIIDMNCCKAAITHADVLERGVDLEMPMAVIYNPAGVPEEFVEAAPPTTGDILAGVTPFVLHYSEFEHTAPELMFDDDRDGALRVHFAVGSSRLDENRGQNAATLKALIDAINVLQEASDSKVRNIVIAGFASPEGSFALNDRLAWSRATVLKRYIMRHCAIDGDVIHIHNGIEDWHGLKLMVESSDLETKDQVLHIIENVPIWDAKRQTGREEEFMKLDRGVTYRHMLRNFYPELRKAAYIKIYYGNESE